jgi:NAD-dependent deacetylase
MDCAEQIKQAAEVINSSKHPVFFGGAGVSTESGIPDFRSQDGLYNQQYKFPPEQIISHSFWLQNPEEFYRFYVDRMVIFDAEPNAAHQFLADRKIPVITQNIDGLHQKAGSEEVYELHGSIWRNYCVKCHAFLSTEELVERVKADGIPRCTERVTDPRSNEPDGKVVCGGIVKPDVVLYEEGLDSATWDGAFEQVKQADTLIVGGTSLVVYPAASLVQMFTGDNLIVINKSPLQVSNQGIIEINAPIGEVFSKMI